ncbi:MAG: hypothetical protein AAGC72_03880 [Planctomycetota bacterium]
MDKYRFRLDVGRWTLSRSNGHPQFELEPDPLMFEPAPDIEDTPGVQDRISLFRQLLQSGEVRNRAELAKRFGISRARVTQILGPINNAKYGG